MLNYWNETLENLNKDQRNDKFSLIVNKVIHKVPLSYAIGISSLISEKYLKDPTIKELDININICGNNNDNKSEKEIQEEFSKFIKGNKISSEMFYEIGIQLKNKEMIKKWKKQESLKELTKEIIMKNIEANRRIFNKNENEKIQNMKEELEYIGEHLEDMKEEIQQLDDDELLFILNNNKTKVENEGIIWTIVKERMKNNISK